MGCSGGWRRPSARYYAEKLDLFPATLVLDQLYPTARPVVMVRDFRDMFCSMRALNARLGRPTFGREQVGSDAEHVDLLAAGADWLWRYWESRRGRAHLVRYEDLVTRPREVARRLFADLGVDASPAAVEAAVQAASADTAEGRGHRTTATPEESVGRWARDLEPDLRARIEDRMAAPLRAFGYVPEKLSRTLA